MTKIIDGKAHAKTLLSNAKKVVSKFKSEHKVIPKVCIIVIGNHEPSKIYVRNKFNKAQEIGIIAEKIQLSEDVTNEHLFQKIKFLNLDDSVHGIILQLPLPDHIDKVKAINLIDARKDVDGLGKANIANLALNAKDYMLPCTALACIYLIKSVIQNFQGLNVVVVGRSNLVGAPLANMLVNLNATVTLCHSYTKNIKLFTRQADVVVIAIGKPNYFGLDYFSEFSQVIDVGINIAKSNKKVTGDVNFDEVFGKIKSITPVPGGVGPMTVAYLLINTIKAACKLYKDNSYKSLY